MDDSEVRGERENSDNNGEGEDLRVSSLAIRSIVEKDLEENPWNPNILGDKLFTKLKGNIEREGFLDPLLVRELGVPKGGSPKFQILDGAHRFRAGKELDMSSFPCIILKEISDEGARFLTLNMNNIRGTDDPMLLSRLLTELHEDFDLSLETLSQLTVHDEEELLKYIEAEESFTDLEPEVSMLPQVLPFEFDKREDFEGTREFFTEAARIQKKSKEEILLSIIRQEF